MQQTAAVRADRRVYGHICCWAGQAHSFTASNASRLLTPIFPAHQAPHCRGWRPNGWKTFQPSSTSTFQYENENKNSKAGPENKHKLTEY